MSNSFHIQYRPDIDGLRAIAIILVILFHGFPMFFQGGFIGVDVFFVISGYLISTIIYADLVAKQFSFKEFYARRVRRIFPALLAVLFSVFIFGWFYLTPREYETLNQEIAGGAAFFSNFIFWRQSGYFDIAAEKKPLLHLWSLAVEEQFYIFWPLILWGASKLRANLLQITLFILLASFGLNIFYSHVDPVGDFYAPYTRFWELLIGATLACFNLTHLKKIATTQSVKDTYSIIGMACIVCSAMMFNKSLAFPGWFALVPSLGAALLIYSGQDGIVNRVVLKNKLVVWVGLISYPLYLWHWPIFSLARIYFNAALNFKETLLAIMTATFLSWATYQLIEKPIRKSHRGSAKIFFLALLMGLMGTMAYFVKEGGGYASRFPVKPLQRVSQLTGCDNVVKDGVLYPCTFGNLHAEKIVLIYGDSHAGHLTNALNYALGDRVKFIFLGYGDCLMSDTEGADKDQLCQLMWDQVRKLRHEQLYAVIHAQRWGDMQPDILKMRMKKVFEVVGLSPKKIAIVGSIPSVDLDCSIANYYIPARNRKCSVYEDQIQANQNFVLNTKGLPKPNNLIFVYPYEKLCPQGVCKVIEGSTSNYWDDAHMSRDGALMSIPDLIQYLKQ